MVDNQGSHNDAISSMTPVETEGGKKYRPI
jgi:hypothetical protein